VVVAIPADPAWLSPLYFGGSMEARILGQNLLYTPLFRPGADLEPEPVLVERWDTVPIAADSLQLTLRLRTDVYWHDGVPTTAADVSLAYGLARRPEAALPHGQYFEHYSPDPELLDARTIRFRLRRHRNFLANLYLLLPAPAHLLGDVAPEAALRHGLGRAPVGNGPFRFVRYLPDQEWVFERNPGYPLSLGGPPWLERLVLRVIPDPTTRLMELSTGRVDVLTGGSAGLADAIERTPGVRLVTAPSAGIGFVVWNTRIALFGDARVRRAMSLAIDREAIVSGVRGGRETAGASTARPFEWMFDPAQGAPYDLSEAARLLDEAGWRDRDGDGIREDPIGRPFRFTMTAMSTLDYLDVLTVLQAQLRRIGVDVRPRLLEPGTTVAALMGSPRPDGTRERDFEAAIYAYYSMGPTDDTPLFHSRRLNGPLAASGFQSARTDRLLDSLAATQDRDEARPLWQEYHRTLLEEAPITVISYRNYFVGVGERVQGVEVHPGGEFVSVARWWVSQ
jgi:peptide/nickel transport system substrate-binding protein